jgi:hypothetical protein
MFAPSIDYFAPPSAVNPPLILLPPPRERLVDSI